MIPVDEFGNLRAPQPSGKGAIKRSERAASRDRRAKAVRRARRLRVLLTRAGR